MVRACRAHPCRGRAKSRWRCPRRSRGLRAVPLTTSGSQPRIRAERATAQIRCSKRPDVGLLAQRDAEIIEAERIPQTTVLGAKGGAQLPGTFGSKGVRLAQCGAYPLSPLTAAYSRSRYSG